MGNDAFPAKATLGGYDTVNVDAVAMAWMYELVE